MKLSSLKPYSKDFYIHSTELLDVIIIPTRSDNYTYLIKKPDSDSAYMIDCADYKKTLKTLKELDLNLTGILLTHHHHDHVHGVDLLLREFPGALLFASPKDIKREVFQSTATAIKEGDQLDVLGDQVQVIETPGHTTSHVTYYFQSSKALFCGDTVFSLGCGRIFEQTPAIYKDFFNTFKKLMREIPADAWMFCAHEYTHANFNFCTENHLVTGETFDQLEQRLEQNHYEKTIPSVWGFECEHNPFLKAQSIQELKTIRTLKDQS